jgi:hypothetical protein
MSELIAALERLGEEIERVAREADAPQRARRRRALPVHGRALVLALVSAVAVAVAAAAVAATTGLLTGEPLKAPAGVGFDPHHGGGAPIASSVRLTALRVADPAGGPAWGLRTLKTSRGLGCVQLGRVQDGKLGVIGQDGAFANDGKFHDMGPEVLSGVECGPLDGAGHAFLAISYSGMPASALDRGCVVQRSLTQRPSTAPESSPCPQADRRVIYYGMLGPQGRAVTYRADDGSVATAQASGPDGAYLVVLRPSAVHPARGGFTIARSPASGLLSVHYRDGSVCKIRSPRRIGGGKACPINGYVTPREARVTTEQVRSAVRASVAPKLVRPREGPAGAQLGPPSWRVTVSFRARVATRTVGTVYSIGVAPRRAQLCGFGGLGGPVLRDTAAGQVVTKVVWVPARCRGDLRITVRLRQGGTDPVGYPGIARKGDPQVGTVTARIPR